jgi:hypothetical protein
MIHEVIEMSRFGSKYLLNGVTVDVKAGNAAVKVAEETALALYIDQSAKKLCFEPRSRKEDQCVRGSMDLGVCGLC